MEVVEVYREQPLHEVLIKPDNLANARTSAVSEWVDNDGDVFYDSIEFFPDDLEDWHRQERRYKLERRRLINRGKDLPAKAQHAFWQRQRPRGLTELGHFYTRQSNWVLGFLRASDVRPCDGSHMFIAFRALQKSVDLLNRNISKVDDLLGPLVGDSKDVQASWEAYNMLTPQERFEAVYTFTSRNRHAIMRYKPALALLLKKHGLK